MYKVDPWSTINDDLVLDVSYTRDVDWMVFRSFLWELVS